MPEAEVEGREEAPLRGEEATLRGEAAAGARRALLLVEPEELPLLLLLRLVSMALYPSRSLMLLSSLFIMLLSPVPGGGSTEAVASLMVWSARRSLRWTARRSALEPPRALETSW